MGGTLKSLRGSGLTTRQLLALPKDGWYFYYGNELYYRHLCQRLNRTDIILKSYTVLREPHRFYGHSITGYDIDHAVMYRKEGWSTWEAQQVLDSRVII